MSFVSSALRTSLQETFMGFGTGEFFLNLNTLFVFGSDYLCLLIHLFFNDDELLGLYFLAAVPCHVLFSDMHRH
jgi:hypothetical protein